MAQRLVRKLCPDCKKQIALEGKDKEIITNVISEITDKTYLDGIDQDHMWQAVGCDKCNNVGYKGRIGVYEGIIIDENIEKIVSDNPSEREVKKASLSQNLLDIKQDGILKILQGVTTLDELKRVVDIEKQ